ncbi:hypothetical protein B0H14DRAFT_2604176 [Mycena olivaceomarginata]|nr:hypothetical protein B0H14DRAFT_2604176 [Mycena olivaceomarginata]
MIDNLSLYNAIFNVVPLEVKGSLSGPIAPSPPRPSGSALENLTSVHPALVSSAKDDPGAMARLYPAAALLPHFGISYPHKKRMYAAVQCAVHEMLELGTQNHYLDCIPLLFEAAEFFEKNPDLSRSDRKEIGLFLRGKALHHPSSNARWPGAWTGAVLARVMEWQLQNPKGTADNCTAWLKVEQSAGRINIDSEPASKRARTQR